MTGLPTADDMLAVIRDMAATLPTRCPSLLRVGPGVLDVLKRLAAPASLLATRLIPYGVDIVEDDGYPIGVWRVFDQWDEELDEGVIPVPGATVQVDGKDMRVVTVDRDEQGRITNYWAADAALLDFVPPPSRSLTLAHWRPRD